MPNMKPTVSYLANTQCWRHHLVKKSITTNSVITLITYNPSARQQRL